MVAGNVLVHFKEPVRERRMPTLELTFGVLTMDRSGHITWPTNFDAATQAALRMQARALLAKMIADPLNPVDAAFQPALTQSSGSVRVLALLPPAGIQDALAFAFTRWAPPPCVLAAELWAAPVALPVRCLPTLPEAARCHLAALPLRWRPCRWAVL